MHIRIFFLAEQGMPFLHNCNRYLLFFADIGLLLIIQTDALNSAVRKICIIPFLCEIRIRVHNLAQGHVHTIQNLLIIRSGHNIIRLGIKFRNYPEVPLYICIIPQKHIHFSVFKTLIKVPIHQLVFGKVPDGTVNSIEVQKCLEPSYVFLSPFIYSDRLTAHAFPVISLNAFIITADQQHGFIVTCIVVRIGKILFKFWLVIGSAHQIILPVQKFRNYVLCSRINILILPARIFCYLIEIVHHNTVSGPILICLRHPLQLRVGHPQYPVRSLCLILIPRTCLRIAAWQHRQQAPKDQDTRHSCYLFSCL